MVQQLSVHSVSVPGSGLGGSALQRGNFRRILAVYFNKGIPSGFPSLWVAV